MTSSLPTLLLLPALGGCSVPWPWGASAPAPNSTAATGETAQAPRDCEGTAAGCGVPPDPVPCGDPVRPGCFVRIEGGRFSMGAQARDPDAPHHDPHAQPDEAPVHEVHVSTFYLQATEMPLMHLVGCVRDGACDVSLPEPFPDPNLPATRLTWSDARDLCGWIGGRLPTEAEWEYAATQGTYRRYPWGKTPRCAHRTTQEEARLFQHRTRMISRCGMLGSQVMSRFTTAQLERAADAADLIDAAQVDALCDELEAMDDDQAVARTLAFIDRVLHQAAMTTDLPSCDMASLDLAASEYHKAPRPLMWAAGNAAEWVADGYHPTFYERSPARDPVAPPAPDGRRVLRGGSHLSLDPAEWRTTARAAMNGQIASKDTGVRCALDRQP